MDTAVPVIAILGFIFGLLGFIAAAVTCVIVLGWKNSTHRIEYRRPEETREEFDAPPEVISQLPSSPEPITLQKWMAQQQSQLDGLYEQTLE